MGWRAELTSHDALRKVCGRKASEGPWLFVARRSYPEGRYCVVFDQEGRHQVAHRLVIRQHRHRATAVGRCFPRGGLMTCLLLSLA